MDPAGRRGSGRYNSPMELTRREALKRLAAGAGAGALVTAGGYGVFYERHALRLVRQRIPVSGLPPALAGLRVGLLSDVHRSRFLPAADLDRAVSLVMSAQPHLVALLGDYVTFKDRTFVESCADGLSALHAPHGVVAVMGNHDDEIAMPRALARRGFTVLDDDTLELDIRGERLSLAGIDYWTTRPRKIGALVRAGRGTTILLAHDPRRLAEALAFDVPLVLSGHTHGGQIVLPFLGAVAARKFPIAGGSLRRRRTSLHVSRGVGTVFVPCRLNCPPEVSVLTLEPAGDSALPA
jgi:predicted MPP superfamily phosphohydrolase